MAVPHPVPPELAELIAARFRALGEPMRVRILDLLRDGDASVGGLAESLGTSQQNVSKHIEVLVRSGMVGREKKGTAVRLWIADPAVFELCETVCGGLGRDLDRLRSLIEPPAVAS